MKVKVLKNNGEDAGRKATLADNIFNIEPNDHAIYLDVKQFLANQRQGTHKSKERAEITGSTKKIKRQKGTGTARAGSIKSPLFRGGGRTFGPRPRNYGFKLNKKVKNLAKRSALTYKAKADEISVLEDFALEAVKTKDYIKVLKDLAVDSKKILMIIPEKNQNLALSSRNVKNAKVVLASNINTYEVLHADQLLVFEGSLQKIEEILN
ncbi:MAG: 50S ribosomal protein L4 [Cyclobacteriaceae bacterium]|jgi:large subunit ribosomal protein L4